MHRTSSIDFFNRMFFFLSRLYHFWYCVHTELFILKLEQIFIHSIYAKSIFRFINKPLSKNLKFIFYAFKRVYRVMSTEKKIHTQWNEICTTQPNQKIFVFFLELKLSLVWINLNWIKLKAKAAHFFTSLFITVHIFWIQFN